MTKYKEVHPTVRRILSMRDEIEYHLSRENRTVEQEFNLILIQHTHEPLFIPDISQLRRFPQ